MSNQSEPLDIDPANDEPIGETFSRLIASGKDFAQAELDKQKARAILVGSGARDAAIFFGVAAILLFAALAALLVGLILILAPWLTAAGATAAVIGGVILIAVLLTLVGRAKISRMTKALRQ